MSGLTEKKYTLSKDMEFNLYALELGFPIKKILETLFFKYVSSLKNFLEKLRKLVFTRNFKHINGSSFIS